MKVFDLHCHPTLKPLLSLKEERPTPWFDINIKADNIAGNIYDSQSNFEQLLDGGCNLACVGLMGIETEFLRRCLVKVLSGPVKYIDKKQVKKIGRAASGSTYEDLLKEEVESVINSPANPEDEDEKVKFISSMNEYNEEDQDTLHLIASLEGGHGLYYGKNEYAESSRLVNKIKAFRVGEPVQLFYLTLSHISQNALANHAFAIKILKKSVFYPENKGISELGHEIIQTCLSDELPGKPVLIDVKHLSLAARNEFYAKYASYNKPIIASHVAVAGCSNRKKPIIKVRKRKVHPVYKVKYKREPGYLPDTFFNPDSLNLYDEDITAILKSGGFIGLILDERVLGYPKNKTTSKEFISEKEWDEFIAPIENVQYMSDEEDIEDDVENDTIENELNEEFEGKVKEKDKNLQRLHAMYLLNNILHIIKVGDAIGNGVDPRKMIGIGSDFDGLIDPVQTCTSAEQFDDLADELKNLLEHYQFDEIGNVNEFIENFFYRNGLEFLKKNF